MPPRSWGNLIPRRARVVDPLHLPRRQRRRGRWAGLADADYSLAAALAPSDVLQQRLVTAAAVGDAVQIPADVHPVELVIVIAGDHRSQPRRDGRLGEPGCTMLDRRDLGLVPGAQPGQEGPEVLQR